MGTLFGETIVSTTIDTPPAGGREFSIGAVISDTFSTYFANFIKFTLLGLILYLPMVAMLAASLGTINFSDPQALLDASASGGTGFFAAYGFINILMMLGAAVIMAGITYAAIEYKSGKSVSVGDMLRRSLSVLLPLIGAAILYYIAVAVGMILLVIPGIIVALMLMVSFPAVIAEQLGPIEALRRSRELTNGHKWSLFGGAIVYGIVISIVQIVLMLVFGMLGPIAMGIGALLMYAVSVGLGSCFIASVYTNLRESKEGIGISDLAAVFE
jgi:hypothetical protein